MLNKTIRFKIIFLKLSHKFIVVLLAFLQVATCFAPPDKPEEFNVIKEKLRIIPKNSLVEGSGEFGGIQPDYEIDADSHEMQRVLKYARALKEKKMSKWEKIDKISRYIKG